MLKLKYVMQTQDGRDSSVGSDSRSNDTSEFSLKYGQRVMDNANIKKEIMVINELSAPKKNIKPPLGKTDRSYAPQG
jgi:hypothetical protein